MCWKINLDLFKFKKWWLKQPNTVEFIERKKHPRGMSLKALRDQMTQDTQKGIIPQWNELLVGLSLEGLVGVFAQGNDFLSRIKALCVKFVIKKQLGKDLPLFIMTPEAGVIVYDTKWQQSDLSYADGLL